MATRWAASDGSEIVSDLRSLLNTQDCFVADYREACHVFRIRPPPLTRFRSLVSVPIHRAGTRAAACAAARNARLTLGSASAHSRCGYGQAALYICSHGQLSRLEHHCRARS